MSRNFVALIKERVSGRHDPWVILRLPDPHSGELGLYVLSPDELLEVHRVHSGERSWFVGDSVQEDGSLLTFTPIDALFILLPILDAARRKTVESNGLFRTLRDIAEDCSVGVRPEDLISVMELPSTLGRIGCICDAQDCGTGEFVYRLNDEKAIAWLRKKVDVIAGKTSELKALHRKLLKYAPAALEDARVKELVQQQLAVRIVEDYLSDAWAIRLSAQFDFSEVQQLECIPAAGYLMQHEHVSESGQIRKSESQDGMNAKKTKLTTGQQKLSKANIKGMKKMDAFFSKKLKENIPA